MSSDTDRAGREVMYRPFVDALADRIGGRLRIGAIAVSCSLVLAATAFVAAWPTLSRPAHLAAPHTATARGGPAAGPAAGALSSGDQPASGGSAGAATSGGAAGGSAPAPTAAPPAGGMSAAGGVAPAADQRAAALPQAGQLAPQAGFTFEDGGTDGWSANGHVRSLGTGSIAHDGARSLHAVVLSSNASDLPYLSVQIAGSSAPAAGQTITAFVFVSVGPAAVQARLYVQDTRYAWHSGPLASLSAGAWTKLTLSVPAGVQVQQLGIQFLCTPANTSADVDLDSVGWR